MRTLNAFPAETIRPTLRPTFQKSLSQSIRSLLGEKFYPCIAAVQGLATNAFIVREFKDFGTGESGPDLRETIVSFLNDWKKTRSTTSTLWAVFPGEPVASEEDFEKKMWAELSALSSEETFERDQAPGWSSNPDDRNFTVCIEGFAFFVVGLHPKSSRKGRRFDHPALIFNVYDQFRDLQAQGLYQPMVDKNRERDIRYSGSVNPMAAQHGDDWETIQFSGRSNEPEWKCPFQRAWKKLTT